jgi:integrase/recombinase XerD
MASVKIILRPRANKDGTHPLILQIIKDRRTSISHLGHHIKKSDWDDVKQEVKKTHPNSKRLNNFLFKAKTEANDKALEIETLKKDVSAQAIKQKYKPSKSITFFGQGQAYLNNLKAAGKYNQYTPDKSRVDHFKEFIGGDIAFQDITPALLDRFKDYSVNKLKLSERSAINHLVMVRSVFSFAIKQQIIDGSYYPFGKGKTKIRFPDSNKIGLTIEEVKSLEELTLENPTHDHARNLWLFSFYFAGMRVSDVLRMRWSDIQDNRLHYTMGKNSKGGSLVVPDKAVKIIEQYKAYQESKNDLIFPELRDCDFSDKFKTQRTIAFKTSAIDKCLRNNVAPKANINKRLTMHIARHTFGNLSGDKIPLQMLQKLYRHSNISTTIGYQQNFIHKEADDALNAVVAFEP